MRKLEKKNPH